MISGAHVSDVSSGWLQGCAKSADCTSAAHSAAGYALGKIAVARKAPACAGERGEEARGSAAVLLVSHRQQMRTCVAKLGCKSARLHAVWSSWPEPLRPRACLCEVALVLAGHLVAQRLCSGTRQRAVTHALLRGHG
jgi:hypothetical protein